MRLLPPDVIIASSSSGLTMSEIQKGCPSHPERCVIGHPFNPPHLIPLVENDQPGGEKTSEATIRRASDFYTALGKRTVRLHKELPGHVANRLQAAVAREVYHLVGEGVVSVADVDTALCLGTGAAVGHHGPGTASNHLGGGPGGNQHFFGQFTGPLTAWWKVLGNPVLTPELQNKLADGGHTERLDRGRSRSWRRSAMKSYWDFLSSDPSPPLRQQNKPLPWLHDRGRRFECRSSQIMSAVEWKRERRSTS